MKRILFLLAISLSMVFSTFTAAPQQAKALSGSEFNAGRIIDDNVFFNGATIGTDTIQAFLNSKVPNCDTNGTQPYNGTTRAAYSATKGYYAPFTCLRNYSQDTPTKAADGLCNQYTGGNKPAAQIIYEVGSACGVSQKVLLVLLEKEQSLVTDDWPWSIQYRSATGYGCPDTAPCDSDYYGFFNQTYNAARQFKRYVRDSNLFSYRAYRNNNIQYNPNASCGSSSVYIQSQATAALYNYTPYQPNASALNNLYGSGDSCGAYGNRNFWRLYRDWFGGTFTQSYSWQLANNGVFEIFDETNSVRVDPGQLKPGTRYFVKVAAKNTGGAAWTKDGFNPVLLATYNPDNHASPLCDSTWPACSRASTLKESVVNPGEIGNFQFFIKAPTSPGEYREYFKPVAENLSWLNEGPSFGVRVVPETYTWRPADVYKVFNEAGTVRVDPGQLKPGYKYTVKIDALNTGTATWRNSGAYPMLLATSQPTGKASVFCDPSWPACSRLDVLEDATVAPGQVGHFTFKIQAPYAGGEFREYFKPVAEYMSWTNDVPEMFGVRVNMGSYSWQLVNSVYEIYNEAGSVRVDPGNLRPSTKYLVKFKARNTGTATWEKTGPTPLNLATSQPTGRNSALCDTSWLACSRPTTVQESTVAPGAEGNFQFIIKTPATPGTYRESFKPVAEFLSWTNETPDTFGVVVRP